MQFRSLSVKRKGYLFPLCQSHKKKRSYGGLDKIMTGVYQTGKYGCSVDIRTNV